MIDCDLGVLLSDRIPLLARDWRNQECIRLWCRQTGLITKEAHQAWIDKIKHDKSIQMFGIVAEAEGQLDSVGEFVGVCGLTSINMSHRTAEFSLYCAPEYQGSGYAKRALVTLLNYGFNELGLNNIWGEVLEGNPALGVFKRLGFTHEGHLRNMYYKRGRYLGADRVSMLKSEFNLRLPMDWVRK